MRHLSDGVYACVGTAGPLNLDFFSQEILGRLAQLALHGSRVVLLLPTAVLGAVVFERELPGFQFLSVCRFCGAVLDV